MAFGSPENVQNQFNKNPQKKVSRFEEICQSIKNQEIENDDRENPKIEKENKESLNTKPKAPLISMKKQQSAFEHEVIEPIPAPV